MGLFGRKDKWGGVSQVPAASAVESGREEADRRLFQSFDDDAVQLFNKLQPLVNNALQHLAQGRGNHYKNWSCRYRGRDAHNYGSTLCSVSTMSSGVVVHLYDYWGGRRVQNCFEQFYGYYGYEVSGNTAKDHTGREEPSYYNIFVSVR